MYHYHKKTHEPIPASQLCAHGCGMPALFRGTGGIYTCLSIAQHCPEYIKQTSVRVTKSWENSEERKQKTKETFAIYCSENVSVRGKIKETLRKKWGDFTPEEMRDYRHYGRRVRNRAQKWAKEQGYVLGKQTYHVDHRLSIWDAWQAGLSESIVNHPANLQILDAKLNSSKGAKSDITVEELMKLIAKEPFSPG